MGVATTIAGATCHADSIPWCSPSGLLAEEDSWTEASPPKDPEGEGRGAAVYN